MIDIEGAQENSQYLNSNIPLTNIKTITLAPPAVVGSLGMMCRISTSTFLKSYEPSDDGSFDFGTAVIQSTHSIMTDLLRSFGSQLSAYVGALNSWEGNGDFDAELQLRLNAAGITTSSAQFKSTYMMVMTSAELQAGAISVETTANGEKIRSISRHFNFSIESNKPRHLAYFSFSWMMNLESESPSVPVKNDVVFNNGVLSSTTYFYLTSDGKYWVGPVVKDGNEYKTPLDTQPEQMILQLRKTRNIKIQDFRNRSALAAVPVMDDYSDERGTIASINLETSPQIRELDPSNSSPHPYVSDIFLSYEPLKRAKFVFMIDRENLIFGNSVYGKLWKTSYTDLKAEILSRSRIEQVKVFRRRVRESVGSNRLGTSQKYTFEEDDIPFLVAIASNKGGGLVFSPLSDERPTTGISETAGEIFGLPAHVSVINVSDNSFSETARSKYMYYAEITAHDGSKDFLREKLSALKSFSKNLDEYLSIILHSTIRNASEERLSTRGLGGIADQTRTSGFDPVSNNLTQDFATTLRNTPLYESIIVGKDKFINVIDLFQRPTVGLPSYDSTTVGNFVTLLLDPSTTNPNSINSLLTILGGVISKFEDSIGDIPGSSSNSNSESVYQATPSAAEISVEKHFNTIFDLTEHDIGGLGYIKKGLDGTGLFVTTGHAFRPRVQSETLKYYNQPNLGIKPSSRAPSRNSKENLLGYLSPSYVAFAEATIDTMNYQPESVLKAVESKLIANRTAYAKTGAIFPDSGFGELIAELNSDPNPSTANYLQEFLVQSLGLTPEVPGELSSESTTAVEMLGGEDDDDDDRERRRRRNRNDNDEENSSLSDAATSPSSLYGSIIRQGFSINLLQNNFKNKNDAKHGIEDLTNLEIAALPNQMAAFLISNSSNTGTGKVRFENESGIDMISDNRFSSRTLFDYRLLMKIEYLKDFNPPSASNPTSLPPLSSLSSPVWEILDGPNFSRLVGKSVLCRMTKYSIPVSLLQPLYRPEIFDVRVYDEYFILIPDQIIAPPSQETSFVSLSAVTGQIPEAEVGGAGNTSSEQSTTYPPMTAAVTIIDELPTPTIISKGTFSSIPLHQTALQSAIAALRLKAELGTLIKSDVNTAIGSFYQYMDSPPWRDGMWRVEAAAKPNDFTP
jgi:hypothetical protein